MLRSVGTPSTTQRAAAVDHLDALGSEQLSLTPLVTRNQPALAVHYTPPGQARTLRHDPTHGPRGSRMSGQPGQLAICQYIAGAQRGQDNPYRLGEGLHLGGVAQAGRHRYRS